MKQKGFSLIELMIVVSIIGILAAIAVPSFTEQGKKGRRTDAKTMLTDIATRQERHYFRNNAYTGTLTDLGTGLAVSSDGHYDMSLTFDVTKPREFTVTATTKKPDADCHKLSINHQGLKSAETSAGANATNCW